MNTKKESNGVSPESSEISANDLLEERTTSRLLRLNTNYTWTRYTDGVAALQELTRDWVLLQEISKLIESSWVISASLWDRRLATHQKWLFERRSGADARLSVRSVAGGEELFARPLSFMDNFPYASAEIWADWHMNKYDEPGWTFYLPSERKDVASGVTYETIMNVLWSRMEENRDPWE